MTPSYSFRRFHTMKRRKKNERNGTGMENTYKAEGTGVVFRHSYYSKKHCSRRRKTKKFLRGLQMCDAEYRLHVDLRCMQEVIPKEISAPCVCPSFVFRYILFCRERLQTKKNCDKIRLQKEKDGEPWKGCAGCSALFAELQMNII